MNMDDHAFDWLDSSKSRKAVVKEYRAARAAVTAFIEKHTNEILGSDARYLLAAREIGIPIKRGTLIFGNEEEALYLHDYMLMIETLEGNTRMLRFLSAFPRNGWDRETELAVRCLSSHRYAFLYTEEAIKDVGLKCFDLITHEPLFLTDVNFSHSVPNGGSILMGTGILSHGSAWMTTGAALPVPIIERKSIDVLDGMVRNEILRNVKCGKRLPFHPDARQQAEMACAFLRKAIHLGLTNFVRFE